MAIIEQEPKQETAPVEREDYVIQPEVSVIDREGYSELGKILLNAADLIVQYGWVQDEAGNFDDGFCAVGAILRAFPDSREHLQFRMTHRSLIRDLVRFNDKAGRDPWEVVAKLRELAKEV